MSQIQSSTATTYRITADMIRNYCTRGLTVSEMSADITRISGFKCTDAVIRTAAEKYKIDLRKKSKKTPFLFDEEAAVAVTAQEGQANRETGFSLP